MALFEDKTKETFDFPTEPAFLVPVHVRPVPSMGDGHYGVFAAEAVPKNTKFWAWTNRVNVIPHQDLENYINMNCATEQDIQIFLRQGFVLPKGNNGNEDQFFYSNPTDAGRFMNHSNNANCGPDGTLRNIAAGEEMTMDYAFHGNPEWYQAICVKYGVLTEAQVAQNARQEDQL